MLNRIKKFIKKYLVRKVIYTETIPIISGELLKDKVALITGASSGIGFGIAKAFVLQGAKVIITGRNEDVLKKACNELGENAQYILWDASKISQLDIKFNEAVKKFGKIDILVNNAGYHGNQDFLTITEEDYDKTFDVNMKYVFFISQYMAKYLIKNNMKGNILNIVSGSSVKPAWSPYGISKWANRGFTRGLARELAGYGIVVNGIAPGPTATSMSHWSEGDEVTWNCLPSGRLAMPEEIGNLAVYLCSDLGKNIIGETVFCDGGSGFLTMNK